MNNKVLVSMHLWILKGHKHMPSKVKDISKWERSYVLDCVMHICYRYFSDI